MGVYRTNINIHIKILIIVRDNFRDEDKVKDEEVYESKRENKILILNEDEDLNLIQIYIFLEIFMIYFLDCIEIQVYIVDKKVIELER